MPRTTPEAVAELIEVDTSQRTLADVLAPFIESANQLITDVCGASLYTEEKFELLERWVAAHFYGCFDPQLLGETAGPVSAQYFWKTGYVLNQTRQGQMAMLLDTDGNLARWNVAVIKGTAGGRASFSWGGREYPVIGSGRERVV